MLGIQILQGVFIGFVGSRVEKQSGKNLQAVVCL
jgi:hypothetical protein